MFLAEQGLIFAMNFLRATLGCTLAATMVDCSSPHLIGISPPSAGAGNDAGAAPFIPTSMGDPFPVDEPVPGPVRGVLGLDAAFDGKVHLVAWRSSRGISAVRFDPEGNLLDQELLVAPPAMAGELGGSIHVLPKDGGGFDILWSGGALTPGWYSAGAPLLFGEVDSEGHATTLLRAGFPNAIHLPARFELQPVSVWVWGGKQASLFRAIGASEHGDSLVVRTFGLYQDFDGEETACHTGVEIPMRGIVGDLSYARVGDRDFVAAFVSGEQGVALVVKALPARDASPPSAACVVDGVVALRVPLAADLALLQRWVEQAGTRSVRMIAVGDRAVAVWRDWDSSGTSLFAASMRSTGVETVESSPVVTLAHSAAFWPANDVVAASEDGVMIVAVRGVGAASTQTESPVAVRVDPRTLAPVSTVEGDGSVSTLSERGSVSAFSWDGAKDLAFVRLGPSGFSTVAAAPLVPGQPLSRPGYRSLPGGQNMQDRPAVGCGQEECLIAWRDNRESGPQGPAPARGLRVSKRTGRVLDSGSFALGTLSDATVMKNSSGAIAAVDGGFLYATQPITAAGSSVLSLRVVPNTGEPSEPQLIAMESSAASLEFVRVKEALYLVVLPSEEPKHVLLYRITQDNRVELCANVIPFWGYQHLSATTVGSQILLLYTFEYSFTTALVDPLVGTTIIRSQELIKENADTFALVSPGGQPMFVWAEPFAANGPDYSLRWAPLDDAGKMGIPQTIATDRGTVGAQAVEFDGRGLAILYARKTFPSDPYEIVMRRFDPSGGATQGPDDVRVVATNIMTLGHTFASSGEGQWLAAYAEYGYWTQGRDLLGSSESRVYGRFIYESGEGH